jgi:hypothetical protein
MTALEGRIGRLAAAGAVVDEALHDALSHLSWLNAVGRAEAHEGRQAVAYQRALDLRLQRLPLLHQRRAMLWHSFFAREIEERALGVALVVLQGLGSDPRRHLVQVDEVRPHRAVAGGDHFQRPVESLGDLPQRCRPVPALFLRQLLRGGDHGDRIREGLFDQHDIFKHWD